jgi:hypothetical protein
MELRTSSPRLERVPSRGRARSLVDEWVKVSAAFYGVDAVEREFVGVANGARLEPSGGTLLEEVRERLYEGSNTLRRHLGMDQIGPGGEPNP